MMQYCSQPISRAKTMPVNWLLRSWSAWQSRSWGRAFPSIGSGSCRVTIGGLKKATKCGVLSPRHSRAIPHCGVSGDARSVRIRRGGDRCGRRSRPSAAQDTCGSKSPGTVPAHPNVLRHRAGSGEDPLDGMAVGAGRSAASHRRRTGGRGYGCVCFAGGRRRKGRAQIRDRRVGRLGPVPRSQGWETCDEGLTHFTVEDGDPRQPGISTRHSNGCSAAMAMVVFQPSNGSWTTNRSYYYYLSIMRILFMSESAT